MIPIATAMKPITMRRVGDSPGSRATHSLSRTPDSRRPTIGTSHHGADPDRFLGGDHQEEDSPGELQAAQQAGEDASASECDVPRGGR